ncbi:MAG TPA: hypothetical protein VJT15_10855 [Pyrinomonadaceae bacterium]|nr:hypothetical protein [Pyrinomonadaceae bacterium]
MKRLAILFVLTAVLVNLIAIASRSAGAPSKFVSLEGRFSISLPEQPGSRRMSIPTPFGNAYGEVYEWHTREGSFGIGYADSLRSIDDPESVKKFFDLATETFSKLAAANGGNIAIVKKITLDKHPGIEQRADLFTGSVIQRMYVASRRIYETTVLVKNSQREHESAAFGVLDSFKLLTDPEITEAALKAGPGPLPQTPEAPRAGSDANDEGLRGQVKSVRTDIQYLSELPFPELGTRSFLTTYNDKGNKLRAEIYDFKNNLSRITVYGYLDGARVSAFKLVQRDYSSAVAIGGGGGLPSNKKMDPRYQQKFEFKYDEEKRLLERTEFLSNGEISRRYVYKYEANQKEEASYLASGSLTGRNIYTLDDQGNVTKRTDVDREGSVTSTTTYTYEFDSRGNWIKRTSSPDIKDDKLRRLNPPTVHLRTITYY